MIMFIGAYEDKTKKQSAKRILALNQKKIRCERHIWMNYPFSLFINACFLQLTAATLNIHWLHIFSIRNVF